MSNTNLPTPAEDKLETLRTNYVGFASFAVLIWDHIDTFADEVQYIWKGRKGLFIYLFFFNRYFTPLGFILNLHAYLSPAWTPEVCDRFVKYEGVTVALAVEVVGLMMLLRIRAIYQHSLTLTIFLSFILLIETTVNVYLISHAGPVTHNPLSGVRACSMVFDDTEPYSHILASSSAWIPLIYDTIIFILTLYKTVPALRRQEASFIIQRLFEDGLLYYSVIFSVTLVLTLMIIGAPEGTKNIAAQSEQLITVAMMSRITLSLRKAGKLRSTHIINVNPDQPERSNTKRTFWFLPYLIPGATRMGELWERGTNFTDLFGSSGVNTTIISNHNDNHHNDFEDIELDDRSRTRTGSASRSRSHKRVDHQDPLRIQFVVPESGHNSPTMNEHPVIPKSSKDHVNYGGPSSLPQTYIPV